MTDYSRPQPIQSLGPVPAWLPFAMLALSAVGFLDASYLTVKHYLALPVACSILEGCDKVLTSPYAAWWGVPVALIGVAYYFTLLTLAAGFLFAGRIALFRFASLLTLIGFAASLWFLYLQLFVIHALCLYCLVSTAVSTLLFILGLYAVKIIGKKNNYGK